MTIQGIKLHDMQPTTEQKDRKLRQAAEQFESMMWAQVIHSMRASVPDGGVLKKAYAEDVQQSMFDQALADSMAKAKSTGMAEQIYQQLSQTSDFTQKHPKVRALLADKYKT